jgi:hypothetical protein
MSVEQVHEQKETLSIDILIPGHAARKETALFERSRKKLIERQGGRCFVSNMTAEELGHPLEAHHHPIERCFAEIVDWERFAKDCKAGHWGPYAAAFDWEKFFEGATRVVVKAAETPLHNDVTRLLPKDPYLFVDDMTVNGLLIGKQFHTQKDQGIHMTTFPDWIIQKYAIEGYRMTPTEVIHHDD